MSREIIPYSDRDAWLANRRQDITSTDVAALFGVSPYRTAFELWHIKRGNVTEATEPSEHMTWGSRLQLAIARGVEEEYGYPVEPLDDYMRLTDLRLGASFDYRITNDPNELLECKNVDGLEFKNGWEETEYGLEAPTHIELQLQHQLGVAGLRRGYIAALIGGNRLRLVARDFDDVVWDQIMQRAAVFWRSPEPPPPDFGRDSAFISRLHGYAEAGKVLDADGEVFQLIQEYTSAGADESEAKKRKDEAKAKILMRVGEAEKITSGLGTLNCGMVKAAEVPAYVRKEYRNFRFYPRREK